MVSCSAVMINGGLEAISDCNLTGLSRLPTEADARLIIDADAALPGRVTLEHFQTVAGWHTEDFRAGCHVEDAEPGDGTLEEICRETGDRSFPELLRLLVA